MYGVVFLTTYYCPFFDRYGRTHTSFTRLTGVKDGWRIIVIPENVGGRV